MEYKIETVIANNNQHFNATVTISLVAVTDGDRVIPFDLVPTLRVTRVSLAGQDVPFVKESRKEDAGFYVLLPQAMARGSRLDLTIEYSGDKVVADEGGGNFSVGARESWYPSLNSFRDHSRFHLTFKVPKRFVLMSVGKPVRQWVERDFACSEWDSEAPVAVAGFNYGEFKKSPWTTTSFISGWKAMPWRRCRRPFACRSGRHEPVPSKRAEPGGRAERNAPVHAVVRKERV